MVSAKLSFGPNAGGVSYELTPEYGLFGNLKSYTLQIFEMGVPSGAPVKEISPAAVLTGNGTIHLGSAFASPVVVIPPGISGRVEIEGSFASNTTIYVGGTATINTESSLLSNLTIEVQGGSATAADGVAALSGMTVNLTDGGTFSNGNALLNVLDNTTINFGQGGGTFVENAGGAFIGLINGLNINSFDAAVDKIQYQNLSSACTSYNITNNKNIFGKIISQTITLYGSTGKAIATSTVNLATGATPLPAGTYTQGHSGPLTVVESGSGSHFTVTIDPSPGIVPCFYAGTLIATPEGEIAVEDIRASTVLRLADGREAAVRWVGHSAVSTRFADPLRVLPIRIKAGALGENLPARDLLLSPDHAVFMDGILVNAGALVNGTSIIRDESVPEMFTYYHVELAGHELLLAEGVPSETFLDNIDRLNFHNWDARTAPDEAIAEMEYPRAKSHRQVPHAIRAALAARAAQMQGVEVEAA
ncbi:Hint domain-containing protein [Acidocella sp.]|uniref:Hint domain-containing protein n=1 Tax=Acidocella sp. TaxID=50710 RepID=UPI002618843B|nr:Hint domain-containing protein [Acidocella sp.]